MTKGDVATVERPNVPAKDQVIKPPNSFGEQLAHRAPQFQASLPAHIPVERFMRVVMTAVQLNPALANADRQSLWTSAMKAATDGLLPDGREGALVIYKTKSLEKDERGRDLYIEKVQWMPMIAGIRKKVRNSGEIVTWDAQVVHAKDQFEYELGDDPFIKHKPFMDGDAGPVIAAYSVAVLKGGEKSREVMTRKQIDKVRAASKSKDKGPWVDWYEEMCRKTVARRHSKVLPMSTDLDDIIRRDDELYDLKGAREEAASANGGKPLSLAGKFDALAQMPGRDDAPPVQHDGVTGEIGDETPGDDRGEKSAEDGDGQQAGADRRGEAADANPAKSTLLDKLRKKAAGGTAALRRAMAGVSEKEHALLTEADHDEIGGIAEEADKAKDAA